MKAAYNRLFIDKVSQDIEKIPQFIHVVIGPRQVGKTTGIKSFLKKYTKPQMYVSADGDLLRNHDWFLKYWIEAKSISEECLLVVDEIQKIENWAEIVKKLWDEQSSKKLKIKLLLLGSSSIQLQKGLNESLAGRYRLHPVYHWDYSESTKISDINLKEYLIYGGYPASYEFLKNKVEWLQYLQNSIIDAVIGKDILSLARVKSPALFKQCFSIACSYSGQELSYTKLLGQLQDKGNTELVKHYLELFEHAFLIKQLFKFSNKKVLSKSSSPKIITLCPALYSVTLDADLDQENYGRAFESMVGQLLSQLPGELYYWREKNHEVDYVKKFGKKIWAIEVKWTKNQNKKGLLEFKDKFKNSELVLIHSENFRNEIEKIKNEIYK